MPLSLALFSDMDGISAMAIRSHWKIGLVWLPIPNFGIFQLNGAEIFEVQIHKGESLVHSFCFIRTWDFELSLRFLLNRFLILRSKI